MPITVILADDHTVLRVGLRAFLEEQTDYPVQVVGECASGEEAVDSVSRKKPDLLLLDLSMEGLGGLGAIFEIRRRNLRTRILVLSQHAEPVWARRAMEAGADGYMVKTARGEELVSAIRAVASGGTYLDPSLAGALVRLAVQREPPSSPEEGYERLSVRERQVLRLVAEGYSNKEIATSLNIAVKTAMAHRANLMDKLGIHNRSRLVQFAIKMGLMSLDD